MIDGPMEPVAVRASVMFEGVVERDGCYQTVADFQRALETWLLETGQPMGVGYVATEFGDAEAEA